MSDGYEPAVQEAIWNSDFEWWQVTDLICGEKKHITLLYVNILKVSLDH